MLQKQVLLFPTFLWDFFKKSGILLIILLFSLANAEEPDPYKELEKTIRELTNKIVTTKKQSQEIEKKIKQDQEAFAKYENQYQNHFSRQEAELDSLKNDYSRLQLRTDSLVQRIRQVKNRSHEFDLMQKQFTRVILASCTELSQSLQLLPPGNIHKQVTALEFLHSELSVHAIDNVEALERLWQILSVLSEGAQSIEVFPGQSPVPYISGQVDFIRLGYAYLAVVNEKGTAAAIWIPAKDSTGGKWQENKDPQQLLALKKCVQIRQGNSVPEIVGIPFQHQIILDKKVGEGERP